ncbi:MAG: ATP synthase F1 subunit delta [Phycisphaerales bacterium]|jgi:F-type H+-transporting ATPase subunit delta|nr:ATP synthase F1 subunit delta [Phycisphaerales bacterium]
MPLIDTQPGALAKIYARSLIELAMEQGGRDKVEAVLGELQDVIELAASNPKFNEFLASRVVTSRDRAESLRTMFEGAVDKLTLNFLLVLNRKGRLGYIIPIVAALDGAVQAAFGRVEVDVFTASPLDSAGLASVRERLAGSLKRDVVVHPYVDGSMIGGVKFRIGDQLVDASVATRLRKLRDRLGTEGASALRERLDRMFE